MSQLPNVAVVMPAYNEECLVDFLVEIECELRPKVAGLRFIVVDDASHEALAALIPEWCPLGSPVDVLRNAENVGHGPSALRAYHLGIVSGADVVVHVDGDGQFPGVAFAALLDALRGHDGAVGIRTNRQETWFRNAISSVARVIVAPGPGRASDVNTPLRAYWTSTLEAMLAEAPAGSAVPHLHFSMIEHRAGLDIANVPVAHRPRLGWSKTGTTWGRSSALLPSYRLLRFSIKAALEVLRAPRYALHLTFVGGHVATRERSA